MAETESFLNPSRRTYIQEGNRSSGNKTRIILILLGIIILIGLVAYAAIATGGKGEDLVNNVPSPTQVIETPTPVEEEPTPAEEVTPTPRTSPTPGRGTPTPTGTSTTDRASGLDRADLTIAVKNGSGVAGAATKASDALKKLGYDVVSSGNADNFEYEDTVIQVKSTKKGFAELLKKDLSGDYTIGSTTSNYTGTDADAVVIVGQN